MKEMVARAAFSAVVMGMVLASDAGAQGRNPPRESGRGPQGLRLFLGSGSTIGLSVSDPSPEDLRQAKQAQALGAVVSRVVPESPAARAGFAVGDLVVELDGERVRGAQHLMRLVRETPSGRKVTAAIVRAGVRQTLEVTPEPSDASAFLGAGPEIQRDVERRFRDLQRRFDFRFDEDWTPGRPLGARGRLGMTLTPLSDQLAKYFGVMHGVLVASVEASSPAARAGLQAGDVVTAVDGQPVDEASDIRSRAQRAEPGATLTLTVMRDKRETSVKVVLPADGSPGRTRSI
jgi:serine protease Do